MSDQLTVTAITPTQISGLSGHHLIAIQTLTNPVYLSRETTNGESDFLLVAGDILIIKVIENNLHFYSTSGCTVAWIEL